MTFRRCLQVCIYGVLSFLVVLFTHSFLSLLLLYLFQAIGFSYELSVTIILFALMIFYSFILLKGRDWFGLSKKKNKFRRYLQIWIYSALSAVFLSFTSSFLLLLLLDLFQTMGVSEKTSYDISRCFLIIFTLVVIVKGWDWFGLSKKKNKKSPPSDESGDDCQS